MSEMSPDTMNDRILTLPPHMMRTDGEKKKTKQKRKETSIW